ncbi:hypothetical protein EZS27_021891, partial [termite gut metagenome]
AKRSLMICHENLLKQRQNKFYHDYKVAVATAENGAGLGVNKCLASVLVAITDNSLKSPLESKT